MILLPMKELLEKFNECDTFSLTCPTINWFKEKEYLQAIENSKMITKEKLRDFYNEKKDELAIDISFEKIYSDIEEECRNYYVDKFKKYKENFNNNENLANAKKLGFTGKKINDFFKDFVVISILDNVGTKTKYGKDNHFFFYRFYDLIINHLRERESLRKYCYEKELDYTAYLPEVLKNNLIKCELSLKNEVTTRLDRNEMVNYYFKLNDETKAYLLNFENDFELIMENFVLMEDFALYKDGVNKYYSCTHEEFNSLDKM